MRKVTGQQQIKLNRDLSPHSARLKTWNDSKKYLEKKFKDYSQMNQLIEPPNDEKEEEKQSVLDETNMKTARNTDGCYEFDSTVLFRQYSNCTNLLYAQEARLETVDEYIMPLNETKSKLRRIAKQYEEDVNSLQKKHDEIDSKYQKTMQKRMSLQESVKKLMNLLNETLDEENELNRQQVNTLNDLNVLKLEQNEYEQLLQKSRSLTTEYLQYITDIESASYEINEYFNKRWDLHEKKWEKWSSDDVVNWIKYLNQTRCKNKICLSNKVDLTVVQQNIIEHGICGDSLDEWKRNEWTDIGVQVFDDRRQIHAKIEKMINKYPRDAEIFEKWFNDKDYNLVPPEFRCPISGEIMKDPVRCSDNKIYERVNVDQYIKKYGQLPGSDEQYDKEDHMFKSGVLKKEIQQFLSENPQFQDL